MHHLFSYGTLQLKKVQLENYGRILNGKKDVLYGYRIEDLLITDEIVLKKSEKNIHPVAVKTNHPNDFIEGIIFEITETELAATDQYEVSDYKRVLETFASGNQAWIYVARNNIS
ncbi:MAG: gamma-glutamylcyclotransferase [Chitinophagales bacterium]|nr:gamma-glutamylcyclotransferase [Chitinophagales bacterium]